MRKTIYISILLMSFFSAVQAQKKIIYEDTSLLQKDEEVIAAPVVEAVNDTVIYTPPAEAAQDEETAIDTSLYKNNLHFAYDSIKNWRNLKDYSYTKYLDSLLKSPKEKEAR